MKSFKFLSRRNSVIYDEREDLVIKSFTSEKDFVRETKIYHQLKENGFEKIPHILKEDSINQELKLEYLHGETVLEAFEKLETSGNIESGSLLILKVFNWLDEFYKVLNTGQDQEFIGLTLGDVNLRNFIILDEEIYGFDFESCKERTYKEEKVEILARILLYNPKDSDYKKKVVRILLESISGSNNHVEDNAKLVNDYVRLIIDDRKKRKR